MSARGASAIVAGLVLLVGVVLGFALSPSVSDPVLGTISCGSPFHSSTDAASADLGASMANFSTNHTGECASALTGPRIAAWSLIGVGGLGVLFFVLTMKATPAVTEAERRPVAEESAQ